MFKGMIPREEKFFDLFDRHAEKIVEGAQFLRSILADYTDLEAKARHLKEIERQGDENTHAILDALHRTFVTPFDREEIHRLAERMDAVLNITEGVAERLFLYDVPAPTDEMKKMVETLVRATESVREGVLSLRKVADSEKILQIAIEIHRLENENDFLHRRAVARLFREEKDALAVLKWKEIYEAIEEAVDVCEEVAKIFRGIVLEHA